MKSLIPILVAAAIATPAAAGAVTLSPEDRKAIVSDVVEHFRTNPGQLVEAIIEWRRKSEPALISETDPASGSASADVSVIDFVDYGCEPCRAASKALAGVVKADGNVRVIHKDYPASGTLARAVSTAILSRGSGAGWHKANEILMDVPDLNDDVIVQAVKAAGTDQPTNRDILLVDDALDRNALLAKRLGVRELPAMIVIAGDNVQVLTGPITGAEISASVARLREASRQ